MSYTEPNEIGSKNGTNVSMDKVSVIRLSIVIAVLASLASATGLLSGVLGYFLYTYASYLFGVAYNQLFLLYAALVALSLFAFIGALGTVDLVSLPDRFSTRLPRRFIAGYMLLLGLSITLMWLGRIGPALADGRPPEGLELYTTLVIQGLDFGVLLPSIFLAGVLLWQGRNWGFLLAPVVLVKGSTLLLAIVAMIINEAVSGIPVSPVESVVFGAFTVANIVLTLAFLMYTRDR